MYADDLLLVSSTCSDLRRMLRGRYLASPRYIIPSLLTPRYFSDTSIPRIPIKNIEKIFSVLRDETYFYFKHRLSLIANRFRGPSKAIIKVCVCPENNF